MVMYLTNINSTRDNSKVKWASCHILQWLCGLIMLHSLLHSTGREGSSTWPWGWGWGRWQGEGPSPLSLDLCQAAGTARTGTRVNCHGDRFYKSPNMMSPGEIQPVCLFTHFTSTGHLLARAVCGICSLGPAPPRVSSSPLNIRQDTLHQIRLAKAKKLGQYSLLARRQQNIYPVIQQC